MKSKLSLIAIFSALVVGLSFFQTVPVEANVYPGTNTGAIPDGLTGTPPQYGAARVINFAVSGMVAPVGDISVDVTLTHTWVGDVDIILRSPGDVASHVIVSRIGVTTAGSFGDSSNFAGTYRFNNGATTNIWTVATTACGDACNIAPGLYRTTAPGQTGQTNPAPFTNMVTPFAGLTTAQINGTWTLSVRDAAQADTGTVTAASLNLITPSAAMVSVSGRVTAADGRAVPGAIVTINGPGGERSVMTNPFGYYRFYDVASGSNYIVTVSSKSYTFTPRSVSVVDSVEDLDFAAN